MHALARCFVVVFALGIGTTAWAQDQRPVAGRLVSIEVAILELAGAGEKLVDSPDGNADQVIAKLRELEGQGKLAAVTRVRFATVEEQSASAQFGETASIISGRSVVPSRTREGGFGSAGMFTQRQFGTLVSATPRVETDGAILLELQVEKTGLGRDARPVGEPANDENAAPPRSVTLSVRSTIRVRKRSNGDRARDASQLRQGFRSNGGPCHGPGGSAGGAPRG
jgi:hypothetical protein